MSRWPMVALGELCDIRIGRTPSRKEPTYWGPGHPWATISDLNQGHGFSRTRETITDDGAAIMPPKVPAGTVLLSFKLSLGKTARAAMDTYTNEAIAALPIRHPDRLTPEFLELALQTVRWHDLASRAAKGKTLNRSSLQSVEIPIPSREEQNRIANILRSAEEPDQSIIDLKVRLEQLLLRQVSALHQESDTPRVKLSSVVRSFISGRSFPDTEDYSSVSWSVLRVGAVSSGNFKPVLSKPLDASYAPPESHRVSKGDLLINRSNTPDLVGQVAYVWDAPRQLTMPDTIWKFNWRDESGATPIYMWATLRTPHMRHVIQNLASGTSSSMSKINRERMMDLSVPWPSREERVRFEQFAHAVNDVRDLIHQRVKTAEELYSSLQYRAFRGEL